VKRMTADARTRVADALGSCTLREQLVLVLLLYERLTPAEVAEALGLTVRQVERSYRESVADLRLALRSRRGGARSGPRSAGRPSRAVARLSLAIEARLRRAS